MRNYKNPAYKIIDFHTHPFKTLETSICQHPSAFDLSLDLTKSDLQSLGIEKICGSVIEGGDLRRKYEGQPFSFDRLIALNNEALYLRDYYNGFYIPGFHVHPDFVKESILEIERMAKEGVTLIGELVPYMHGWVDYSCKGFMEILDCAERYGMMVNFHPMGADDVTCKQMDDMVASHPNVKFIAAHPNNAKLFSDHVNRLVNNPNYYIDVSGGGLSAYGTLRKLLNLAPDRILFGSDYPTCNPCMFVGAVENDYLLTEQEKQNVFYNNAIKLLKL